MATDVKLVLTAGPSPISPETVALAGVSFSGLCAFGDEVYFGCRDPANQGKTCVKSLHVTSPEPRLRTLSSANVRSAVHEYGGGAFTIGPNGQGVVYTDFPSHIVYWEKPLSEDGAAKDGSWSSTTVRQRIYPADTQEEQQEPSPLRFADFSVVMTNTTKPHLIAIMEDHTDPRPTHVTNSIVSISMDGKGVITTLASGQDFYAYPRINSDGTLLAYVAWDHPNMPWDGTTLYTQALGDVLTPTGDPVAVHGQDCLSDSDDDKSNKIISVSEPRWSPNPDDNGLYFLSDTSGWYNLYRCEAESVSPVSLYPKEADFCGGSQGWVLGLSNFTFLADGTLVGSYCTMDSGGSRVVLISIDKEKPTGTVREFGRSSLPCTSILSLCAVNSMLYLIGGSVMEPPSIWKWERPGDDSCVAQVVVPSLSPDIDLDPLKKFASHPELVRFPSSNSQNVGVGYAFGYFYPSTNVSAELKETDFKPPLLVKAHGGPTSRTSTAFRLDIQFWTSRGFAVLDVDYGGSTGYGTHYRQSLRGNWGVIDVADVCNGAQWCVDRGLVNGDWLCIDGGSAGGYTTLAALVFGNAFSAGASKYGVADLSMLYTDTHKFESRYLDGLVGPYPKEEELYRERCPINYVNQLNCPLLLFQGDEDKVVPPDQAEVMYKCLKEKSLPSTLIMYQGEQHGFRKSENIQHALNSEYDFFCQTFGFETSKEKGYEGITIGARIEL